MRHGVIMKNVFTTCFNDGKQRILHTQCIWQFSITVKINGENLQNNWLVPTMGIDGLVRGRVQLKCDGTRWRKGWEVNGKLANGWVASTLHTTSERGVSSITTADAHNSAASSRLNWRPRRFKWTRPFRWKTKSGLCACPITFQKQSTNFTKILLFKRLSVVFLSRTKSAQNCAVYCMLCIQPTIRWYQNSAQI